MQNAGLVKAPKHKVQQEGLHTQASLVKGFQGFKDNRIYTGHAGCARFSTCFKVFEDQVSFSLVFIDTELELMPEVETRSFLEYSSVGFLYKRWPSPLVLGLRVQDIRLRV